MRITPFRVVSSRRPVCIAALAMFLAGCSGYSRVSPELYAEGRDPRAASTPFEVGQRLKVYLATGEIVEGALRRFSGQEIALAVADDGSLVEQTFDVDDVTMIKRRQFLWAPTALGMGVVSAGVLIMTLPSVNTQEDEAR